MNAYDVAKPLSGPVDGFVFAFGVDHKKVAAQLRKLADAIESTGEVMVLTKDDMPEIYVERVSFESTACRDDFTTSKITMIIAEKIKVAP